MGQSIFENPVYINEANGLPANRVTAIAQDHLGFLWFGTTNGLARFDGSSMIVYQPNDQDTTALSNEFILDILPDSANGKIWVATLKNLSVYDMVEGHFKNYPYRPGDEFSPPDLYPYSIFKDKDGQIWVSFRERGLYKFRPRTDDFERVLCETPSGLPGDPSCISIFNMQADPENDSLLWLGGHQGVYRFNRYTADYQRYKYQHPDKKTEEYANTVRCILPHNDGKVYFGTWYNGVFVLDKKTGQIAHFEPPCVPAGYFLAKDVVNTIYPKHGHEFWISSVKGLQLYDSRKQCVTGIWKNDRHKKKWFSVELIDNKNRIWSASHTLGVLFYNPLLQQFQTNYYEDEESDYFSFTRKILEDTLRKRLYVLPQAGRGLYIFDQKTGTWSIVPPPDDYIGIDDADFLAWDMALRADGSLFIVENSQFFTYRLGAAQLQRYPLQPSKENPRMRKIQKDREGMYWVTGYGWPVQRLDLERNTIYTFEQELKAVWAGKLGADYIEEAGKQWPFGF
jgi:streptogramin lyase